ncbi:hypothetical protein CRENBAI_024080 [Crenichthys baileyi]|uniref:LRRNT domain-containing protein n=1 Tax=Crenichthys baileyi TaxID=28760 RepID=A0AAV9SCY5_9TELE
MEGVVRDRNSSAAWRSNSCRCGWLTGGDKVPGLMESRGAARWRVDRVRLEEAEVMEFGCCQRSLTEYPYSNSWHEKARKLQGTSNRHYAIYLHRTQTRLLQSQQDLHGDSSTVDMDFPKHSILQAFCVMLLAWMLVRCQTPVEPEEEEEEEVMKKADNATLTTTECPSECSCTADGTVDCAGVDLTEFPEELPDKIRRLSLQNNKIKEITVEHISLLHQLETLNLQNNWLTTEGLEDEGFEMLEQLAYLYLANNKVGVEANKKALAWNAKNKRSELSRSMLLLFAF